MTALVTIVLPVFNGSNYLAEAVEALLGQTFRDFELILSDNASTDDTWSICERFAKQDPRVTLFRFDKNMGASVNFNHHIPGIKSKYVKWAAHDDLHRPEYLEACVDVLESDPSVVLCQTGTRLITADGAEKNLEKVLPDLDDPIPAKRFGSMIRYPHLCTEVFGVYRTEVFQKTPLLQPYVGSDRVLLAEVALRGRIVIVLRDLFLNRRHDFNSIFQYPDEKERVAWFDPTVDKTKNYPVSRLTGGYLNAIDRAGIADADKVLCWRALHVWIWRGRHLDRQPITYHLQMERSVWPRVGADDACPCGSGRQYGQCHGLAIFAKPPPKRSAPNRAASTL
jgi:glycosyltransferase involved in cell wall biosynthesis